MTEEKFLAIDWPEVFVVEYTDGTKEPLCRGDGVTFIPPSDDPTGRGGVSAVVPKKHPRIQSEIGRHCYFR